MSRLEKLQRARDSLWKRILEWDHNPSVIRFMGYGGIMHDIRAERLSRMDSIIARLKARGDHP